MADSYAEMPEDGKAFSSSIPGLSSVPRSRGWKDQSAAFWELAKPYFSEVLSARLMLGSLVVLTLLNSGVRVVFSYLVRDFWSALADGAQAEFYSILRNFLVAMGLLAPLSVLYRYQRQKLAIHWRDWMTERVLQLYFQHQVYYGLERTPANTTIVDNPDQRITEDIRSFTEFSLSLFHTILTSAVDLVAFSVILYTILPRLFVAIFFFALGGTLATMVIGKSLVSLQLERLRTEANFRYSLVRVRDHAESVAFLQGEAFEHQNVKKYLAQVVANATSLNEAIRNLDFFTTYYEYSTWILPILVIAPHYFEGAVELGVVNQSVSAFGHVLDDISLVITQWETLTEFSAGIDRLYTFLKVAQNLAGDLNHDNESGDTSTRAFSSFSSSSSSPLVLPSVHQLPLPTTTTTSPGSRIRLEHASTTTALESSPKYSLVLENLTLITPHHPSRVLIQNLHLSLVSGSNLLITGTSGSGKSSLLRAIAGLWDHGSGSIIAPPKQITYFLPQTAYCSMGSLRDQLMYPHCSTLEDPTNPNGTKHYSYPPSVTDHDLWKVLEAVNLPELYQRAGGLDQVLDWSNVLSLGEQQRLAFGRLLVHKPKFAILDESTSALDLGSEKTMYELLASHHISCISVGHRPSLDAFHHTKLILRGSVGGESHYSVEPIEGPSLPQG